MSTVPACDQGQKSLQPQRLWQLQTRLGSKLTWLLVAAAFLLLTGGALGSVTFFALWWTTKEYSAPSTGTYTTPQDGFVSEAGDSDDELASQQDIAGQCVTGCLAKLRCWFDTSC